MGLASIFTSAAVVKCVRENINISQSVVPVPILMLHNVTK